MTHSFTSVVEVLEHLKDLATMPCAENRHMTELDHGLQTADLLRHAAPDDIELQVAGLLHDLAHPWDIAGQPDHARIGAGAVAGLLGERVAALILGHVPAKRYLVATHEEYRDLLSPDSVLTLAAQGGPMSPDEITAFETEDDWLAMLKLRIADDSAKVPGAQVPPLMHWEPLIHSVAARR
jgi:predicted HD phosphohydrolase